MKGHLKIWHLQVNNSASFKFCSSIFVVLVLLVVFSAKTQAQSYILVPNDTIHLTGVMEDLHTLIIQQNNMTNDTLWLKWQKVSEVVPLNWEASVCDNFTCNTTLTDSGIMNPVLPDEYGFLLIHLTPHVNYGTAIIRYEVWDYANPNIRDTLTFMVTVSNPAGIEQAANQERILVFPNPANESINIATNTSEEFNLSIKNMIGNAIFAPQYFSNQKTVDITFLPRGVYILTLTSGSKIISLPFIKL